MATRKRKSPPVAAPTASVSANAVRDFLLQAAELPNWKSGYVQETLGVDAAAASTVLSTLAMAGYIEPDDGSRGAWRNTAAGNAMAKVSNARPVKRRTAEKSIEVFLERVREVNLESRFLYAVERAAVFGPFLTDIDTVKNVDIAVELTPKISDKGKLEERVKADAERAHADGKRFKSYAAKLSWGKDKVWQHLKGRTRALAVVPTNENVLAQPHRVIFDRSNT